MFRRTLFASPQIQLAARVSKSSSASSLEDKPNTVAKKATTGAGVAKKAKAANAKSKSKSDATTAKTRKTSAKTETKTASKAKEKKSTKPAVKKKEKKPALFTPPPKQPASAYVAYYVEQMKNWGEMPVTDSTKIWSERWRNLSDGEKQDYHTRRKNEFTEWQQRVAEWESQQTPEGLKQFRQLNRKRRRELAAKREASLGTPRPARPVNPFMRFMNEYRRDPNNWEGAPEVSPPRQMYIVKKASEKWNGMNEMEKAPYTTPFEGEFKKFQEDLAQWKESITKT